MFDTTHAFLIDIEDPNSTDEKIARQARDVLNDYYENYCDDSICISEQAVVLQTGRVISLVEEPDGDLDLYEEFMALTESDRWDRAWLTALQCVAQEFQLKQSSPSASGEPDLGYSDKFHSLLERITDELPARLSKMWATGPWVATRDAPDSQFARYQRAKWSREMTLLLGRIGDETQPFAECTSPYEYRAFDIASSGKHHAIVFTYIKV